MPTPVSARAQRSAAPEGSKYHLEYMRVEHAHGIRPRKLPLVLWKSFLSGLIFVALLCINNSEKMFDAMLDDLLV